MTHDEFKRKWTGLTKHQRDRVREKARRERMSLMAVLREWPDGWEDEPVGDVRKAGVEEVNGVCRVVEAFATTVEAAASAHEHRNDGGMRVPFHGDFANAPPSVIGRLQWWVREFRAAIATTDPRPDVRELKPTMLDREMREYLRREVTRPLADDLEGELKNSDPVSAVKTARGRIRARAMERAVRDFIQHLRSW